MSWKSQLPKTNVHSNILISDVEGKIQYIVMTVGSSTKLYLSVCIQVQASFPAEISPGSLSHMGR